MLLNACKCEELGDTVADCAVFTSDQCTKPRKDRPVNGPLVRLELGLGVKRHTDRGISWCRGCWDVNLWGLGVLLRGACHLSTQKVIRKQDFSSFFTVSVVIRLRNGPKRRRTNLDGWFLLRWASFWKVIKCNLPVRRGGICQRSWRVTSFAAKPLSPAKEARYVS